MLLLYLKSRHRLNKTTICKNRFSIYKTKKFLTCNPAVSLVHLKMKIAYNTLKLLIALLCVPAILIVNACNSPAANVEQQKNVVLKTVDGTAFLDIIAGISKNIAQNHASTMELTKALEAYTTSYKINYTGSGKAFNKDADYLTIDLLKNEKDSNKVFLSSITLTKQLQKQLTFNNLKERLGAWDKVPANGRPMDLQSVMTTFSYKEAPQVSIIVQSQKLPESKDNVIEEIKISPME